MAQLMKRCGQLFLSGLLLCAVWTHVHAGELPPVQNVQINGDQLTWDAVEGATGYNIYRGGYLATVQERQFTVTETGSYGVTAFNDEGDFSPLKGSNFPFYEGGVDNRPSVTSVSGGIAYITRRCFDVNAGDSCEAKCPGFIGTTTGGFFVGSATGGACASSDTVNVNATLSADGYVCTVSGFTAKLEAQAACLATAQ